MSLNYPKEQPNDKQGVKMVQYDPAYKALARYGTNNPTVSSVITLTDDTTIVEIGAVNVPVTIRWVPSTETAAVSPFASVITTGATANYDHVVAKDTTRQFVVPVERQGVNSIVGINVQSGLYKRIAVIAGATVSSILVAEF